MNELASFLLQLHELFEFLFRIHMAAAVGVSCLFVWVAFSGLWSRIRRPEKALDPALAPTVAIHLPTRNELAALRCARRCLAFDYPEDRVQILIGDDSDLPEVSRRLDRFGRENDRVQVLPRARNVGYKAGNLNHLLAHTESEIIVVFDSDFLPKKDFLRRLVAPLVEDPHLTAVQARWTPVNTDKNLTTLFGTMVTEIYHRLYCPLMDRISGTVTLCGSAEAIRTQSLRELGGWWSGCFTEDIECSIRLYAEGGRVLYLPNLTCEMEVPQRPWDLCRQQMRWAHGITSSIRRHAGRLLSRAFPLGTTLNVGLMGIGYLFTALIFGMTLFGTLGGMSLLLQPSDYPRFFGEMATSILLTSGYMVCALMSFLASGRVRSVPKLIGAMLSLGLVVTWYCNLGVYRALRGSSMSWFLVEKEGNLLERGEVGLGTAES